MADIVTWDPYREFRSLTNRLNRVFGTTPTRREEEESLGTWMPPVDIAEDKDKIILTAELPGFKENDIEIQMEGNVLTLRGERKFEEEKQGRNYHRVERSYGQFVRSFTLPNNVDRDKIKANFHEGILEVELPKREDAKPRQIKVTTGNGPTKKDTIEVKGR
jgi:HSP20 family protein